MEAKGTARPSLFELAPIRRRPTLKHANGVRACLLIFIVFDGLAGSQLPFCKKQNKKWHLGFGYTWREKCTQLR